MNVGSSGLGNRLMAVVSSAILAIMMDRELEIIWEVNDGCQGKWTDLFDIKDAENERFRPLVITDKQSDDYHPRHVDRHSLSSCFIHLDGEHDKIYPNDLRFKYKKSSDVYYHHFALLNDTYGFYRLQRECDVIQMHANMYFAHYLLGPAHGDLAAGLRRKFPRPFHDIANIALIPAPVKTPSYEFLYILFILAILFSHAHTHTYTHTYTYI